MRSAFVLQHASVTGASPHTLYMLELNIRLPPVTWTKPVWFRPRSQLTDLTRHVVLRTSLLDDGPVFGRKIGRKERSIITGVYDT